MIQDYLTSEELAKTLDTIHLLDTPSDIALIILEAYEDDDKPLRKHSNSDISAYARENEEKSALIVDRLNDLINSEDEKISPDVKMIAFKIVDHLKLEHSRIISHKTIELTIGIGIDKVNKEIQRIVAELVQADKGIVLSTKKIANDNANTMLKLLGENEDSRLEDFKAIEENIKTMQEDVEKNTENTKKIKGDIMKEAVAISSVIVTIMGFFLTNAGILGAIADGQFVNSGTNILLLLIKINASMALGISVLMMISASFIHKGSFKRKGSGIFKKGEQMEEDKGKDFFLESTQFKISFWIIIFALIVLAAAVLVAHFLNQ